MNTMDKVQNSGHLASAHQRHNFQSVSRVEAIFGILLVGHHLQVDLHSNQTFHEAQSVEKLGYGDTIGHFVLLIIDHDFHRQFLRNKPRQTPSAR